MRGSRWASVRGDVRCQCVASPAAIYHSFRVVRRFLFLFRFSHGNGASGEQIKTLDIAQKRTRRPVRGTR